MARQYASRRRLRQSSGKTIGQTSASRMYSAARTGAAYGKAAVGIYKKFRAAIEASSSSNRSRTTLNNNRRVNQYVPQLGNDYQRIRARYGKKISQSTRSKKLLRQTLQRSTFIPPKVTWRR
jgi:hypothetical protein